MNVSNERINEVFIMVGRDFVGEKNPYKMKATGLKHDLDNGHVLFYPIEGK